MVAALLHMKVKGGVPLVMLTVILPFAVPHDALVDNNVAPGPVVFPITILAVAMQLFES